MACPMPIIRYKSFSIKINFNFFRENVVHIFTLGRKISNFPIF